MRHVARKRFGQHFLTDPDAIGQLVAAIAPARGERIVEIGPGLGALTEPLLERAGRLDVIEIDRDLCAELRRRFPAGQLTVHEADALEFDFAALPAPMRVVGNLPYNISTPLLFRAAAFAERCTDLHFMLQREVVERMVAPPGGKSYGRLSVMLQYRFRMEKRFDIAPEAFRPPPKVWSAVVALAPRPAVELSAADPAHFARVVARAFSTRRKTLRNALDGMVAADAMAAAGIDPGLRAEQLPVAAFVALASIAKADAA